MIRYSLRCADGHEFDSWFASSAAYDALSVAGMLSCTVCGAHHVAKALMAPAVAQTDGAPTQPSLREPADAVEAALMAMRRHVEENAEYVGLNFVAEAQAIHVGDAPERWIYGEASPHEAKRLIEDGIDVGALPFMVPRKTN